MAALHPFRALRPVPTAAAQVAAVPYDVVSSDEARALVEGNPLSFLRVSRAETELGADVDVHADAVYARAAQNLARLRLEAPLVVEDRASLYVYRLRMGAHMQTGVAACFSLDEYDAGLIRQHEKTRADKEDDRTRHLIALGAQTGPVFLTFRSRPVLAALVRLVTEAAPSLFDFVAADDVQHTVWQVSPDIERDLVNAFAGITALYIADGHHRAAAASRARRHLRAVARVTTGAAGGGERAGQQTAEPGAQRSAQRAECDTVLAVAFPDDQMLVLPYNRVVTDLASHTPESLLTALRASCEVREGTPVPVRAGEVSMFLHARWHTLVLPAPPAGTAADGCLDVSRLQTTILGPLLGIGDPRSDTRIDFVGGGHGTAALESLVHSGRFAVAFSMYPVSVGDLMVISDAGGIMPPKSTWFEPKLRDGLLSHVL
jgi:uncharacterized protein (DUF1015 family)